MFKNENKGIVFKVRWFVRPNINTDVTIIFVWNDEGIIPLNLRMFISGRTNLHALKTIPLFSK